MPTRNLVWPNSSLWAVPRVEATVQEDPDMAKVALWDLAEQRG